MTISINSRFSSDLTEIFSCQSSALSADIASTKEGCSYRRVPRYVAHGCNYGQSRTDWLFGFGGARAPALVLLRDFRMRPISHLRELQEGRAIGFAVLHPHR